MTQTAQPRMAEGVIVLAAAALMALGLGGTVWWQSGRNAPAGEETEAADAAAAEEGLDARRALAEAEAEREAREAAETAARAAEDARIEAVARLELELEDARRQTATATAEKEQLEAETERLTAEVEDLRQKVLQLVDELESLPASGLTAAETNLGPAREPRPEAVQAGPGRYEVTGRALNEARVVDANEELRYAVLDVGSAQGVRPGMQFSVLDGDEVVAQLRAEEVRENVSGMVVEPVAGERFPVPNDRAILSRYADR